MTAEEIRDRIAQIMAFADTIFPHSEWAIGVTVVHTCANPHTHLGCNREQYKDYFNYVVNELNNQPGTLQIAALNEDKYKQ